MLLSTLALVALIAEPNAARRPTTTAEVSAAMAPAAPPFRLTSAVQLGWPPAFARWSVGVGIHAPTLARPFSGAASNDGLLVARIGHGLYLGQPDPPRPEIFSPRESLAATPALFHTGVQLGIDGTLFLTPELGLHFDVRAGSATYGGLSLIWRPK